MEISQIHGVGTALIVISLTILAVGVVIMACMYFDPRSDSLTERNVYRFFMTVCFMITAGVVLHTIASVNGSNILSTLCWILSLFILVPAGWTLYGKMKAGERTVIRYESTQRIRASQLDSDDKALKEILRDEK